VANIGEPERVIEIMPLEEPSVPDGPEQVPAPEKTPEEVPA
jgi:hypothetical protein